MSVTLPFEPVYDYIIIEMPERSETTESGLYTPRAVDPLAPRVCRVVAVGPGRHSEYSAEKLPAPPCGEGDRVLVPGGAGSKYTHDGVEYRFILPRDLLGVFRS